MSRIESSLSKDKGMAVAATLNRPRSNREVAVRCINLSPGPQELKVQIVIGIYQPVKEDQAKSVLPRVCPEPVARCPGHVHLHLIQARRVCKLESQCARLASFLATYQDTFSQGESDVRRTALSSCWRVLGPSNSHLSNWEWKRTKKWNFR